MRILAIIIGGLLVSSCVQAADEVVLTKGEVSLKASIGEEVFAVFQFSKDRKKPFFLPVTGPGGMGLLEHATPGEPGTAGRLVIVCSENAELQQTGDAKATVALNEVLEVGKIEGDKLWIEAKQGWIQRQDVAPLASTVTRLVNDNPENIKDSKSPLFYDHPHHKGVWNSVDEINKIKFWKEDGRIENVSVEVVQASGNPAIFKVENHWINPEEKTLLREVTTFSLYANRLMAVDITFTAVAEEVTFEDTKEGMFAIRLPNSMRESVSNGPVINADGVSGTKSMWGKPSRWVDYCGPINEQVFGVTLMDHPENPWESRYHVRDYGLFAINPCGSHAYTNGEAEAHDLTLKTDENIRFRFGLYVHENQLETEAIEQVYQQFTENR